MKVLLADDEDGIRITLGIALKARGLDVAAVCGGAEALAALKESRFDWLVTDGHMKPMDGYELARRARLLAPRLKVVMITGVDLRPGPHADILKVFTKPLDDDALCAYLLSPGGSARPDARHGAP